MITTLRHQLIRMPTRLVRDAEALILRLPRDELLDQVLARIRACPHGTDEARVPGCASPPRSLRQVSALAVGGRPEVNRR
jgi:hypothetical protein